MVQSGTIITQKMGGGGGVSTQAFSQDPSKPNFAAANFLTLYKSCTLLSGVQGTILLTVQMEIQSPPNYL